MDGDIAPLREICALAAEHGALTYLDETHAAGAYGHEGAGVAQAVGAAAEVTIVQGSLAKGYGTLGGFIAGPAERGRQRPQPRQRLHLHDLAAARDRRRRARERAPPARVGGRARALSAQSVITLREAFARVGVEPMPSESHIVPVLVPGAERCREVARRLLDGARDLRAADQLPLGAARGRAAAHRSHARPRPGARRGARARARHAAAVRVSLNHVALSATRPRALDALLRAALRLRAAAGAGRRLPDACG